MSNTNNPKCKVSTAQAQAIIQKGLKGSKQIAGTPKLVKLSDNYIYAVPVYEDGKRIGSLGIDAQTGEYIGLV